MPLVTSAVLPSIWEYNPCASREVDTPPPPPSSSPPPPPPPPPPPQGSDTDATVGRYFGDSDLTVAGLLVVAYPDGYSKPSSLLVIDSSGAQAEPDGINFYAGYLTVSMGSYRPLIGQYQIILELEK